MEFNAIAVEAATIGKEDIDVWTWTKPVNPNYKLCEKGREIFNRNIVPIYQRYRVSIHLFLIPIVSRPVALGEAGRHCLP